MDTNETLANEIESKIIDKMDKRYALQAYLFVIRSLDALTNKIVQKTKDRRHVTGRELSEAVKSLAIEEFGPTAIMVMEHWGVKTTKDIGNIVYNLIAIGKMGRTESDSIADFDNVYDFKKEFVKRFRFSAKEFTSKP